MHEMALVEGVLGIALKAASENGMQKINAIRIRMGAYCGVVPAILREYFSIAADGTPAQGAELRLECLPAVMRCRACGWNGELAPEQYRCPLCESPDLQMESGREFFVESIEAE